jgi:negative regulator of replication initiation
MVSGYDASMKTTVDLEPELYAAAERLAQSQQKSLGQVVSELLRRTLELSAGPDGAAATELERRNGFDVFPERTGPKATVEGVQQLCREEGI